MADYIEARSLASLNALANNPPQYPTNPTAKKEEPLTLYISRVPGTRDIILSTFKPQIKNVTAEDVASSLYYVHLNTPEDELLISDSPQQTSARPSLDSARSGNLLNRKPVAAVPNASNLGRSPERAIQTPEIHLAAPTGDYEQPYGAPSPDLQPAYTTDSLRSHRPPPLPIHRKPLVPLPRDVAVHTQVPPTPPPHQYIDIPNLPPRPDEIDNYPEYSSYPLTPPLAMRSPSPSKRKHFTPFSLTLIRRDRSSHQQWNVGRISSFQLEHPEQIPDEKYTPAPSISIQLETPGYSKFRGMPAFGTAFDIRDIRESLDMIRPGFSSAAGMVSPTSPQRPRVKPVEPAQPHTHTSPTSAHIFERKVRMAYAPSWTANIRKAFKHRESRDDDLLSPGRPNFETQGSTSSVGSVGGDFDGGDTQVITSPGHGLKPQGYMFLSPWDGRCEFRTGNAGRSLRCRHILPTHTNQWNPLTGGVDEGGSGGKGHRRNGSWSPRPKGNDISELRFNLPSADIFNTKPADPYGPHEARERTRDKIFNSMINRTEDDVDDDEYEGVGFSMSLGREKAGGGNRGKRAKMGKLIIWDEGLKMLDLVVAANVGVWWNVWERKAE